MPTELALLDAVNGGNPVAEMGRDVQAAAAQLDYFAGLATELKGETIPMGPDAVDMTVREPFGVCARIVAYNHPLMFTAAKMGPPLVAGNTVIMKPPHQAPLSAYRMMELIDGLAPPGVMNLLTGGARLRRRRSSRIRACRGSRSSAACRPDARSPRPRPSGSSTSRSSSAARTRA